MPVASKEALRKFLESMSYDDLERKIRDLIDPADENGNRSWRFYIRETFPEYCVVVDNNDDSVWRVDYTVDAEENVSIGQWQEVEYVLQIKPNGKTAPEVGGTTVTEGKEEGEIVGLTRLTEEAKSLGGNKFRMTVIRPGWNVTLDGRPGDKYYTREFIASLLPLIEGAKAYSDHQTDREERERPQNSVWKLVGYWTDAKQEPDGSCTATFNLSEAAIWMRPLLTDAEKLKNEKGIVLVGPSINGYGTVRIGEAEVRRGKIAEACKRLQSIDIVTEPGAGGSVDKILEQAGKKEDDTVDWSKISIDELRQNRPDLVKAIGQDRLKEAKDEFKTEFESLKESVQAVDAENKKLREELTVERIKVAVKSKIGDLLRESKLPDVSQRRLATVLETRDFTKEGAIDEEALKEAVNAAVTEEREYLAKITESGKVTGMGGGGEKPNVVEHAAKIQDKFDGLFGVEDKKDDTQE